MSRIVWLAVSVLLLMLPASVRAEISREDREKVIAHLCEDQMWIDDPASSYLQEVCQMRFEYSGASLWFSYTTETILKYALCLVPKPWCVYPEYTLLIVVRWPASDVLDYEEIIIDNDFTGRPTFGIANGADRESREYRHSIEESPWILRRVPAVGLEHLTSWTIRYEELIAVLLSKTEGRGSAM